MDALVLVSDPTKTGIETASRLASLAKEMKLEVGRMVLVINGVRGEPGEGITTAASELLSCKSFTVPYSEDLLDLNAEGRTLFELSEDDHAYKAVKSMLDQVLQR